MCLSLPALAAFLNLLPPQIIETTPDHIIVHAEARDAVWVAQGDLWCTEAPQIDAALQAS